MLITSDKKIAIVGLGITGMSVARYLSRCGMAFCAFDTRAEHPSFSEFRAAFPQNELYCGEIPVGALDHFYELVVSPGISIKEPYVDSAAKAGVSVIGDVELFLREASKPVVGITGSNGKTSVTTLMGLCAEAAGIDVAVGGNIGVPALDLLEQNADLYVLELSSFQLETTKKGGLTVACNLNLSPDHMDRYATYPHYVAAKQRIFFGAKNVVYNLLDPLTQPPVIDGVARRGFASKRVTEEGEQQFLFDRNSGQLLVAKTPVLHESELATKGLHNIENSLAVMAICDALNIPMEAVVRVLKEFKGLEHRCEYVASKNEIDFINDSKATNIGAAVAAINSFKKLGKKITLIAGGDGKGVCFDDFGKCVSRDVENLILIGRDAAVIGEAVSGSTNKVTVSTMKEAVEKAYSLADEHGVVLLSPACASFDMYSGYEQRGQDFKRCVTELMLSC